MIQSIHFNEEERRLYHIAEAFRDTLVAPTLEGLAAIKQYKNLLSLLKRPDIQIRTGRKSPDTTTFGDIAVLLANSLGGGFGHSPESLFEYFDALEIFFACFGDENEDSKPQSVCDFMHMPFDAFYHFAELCGTLPKACTEAYTANNTGGKSVTELFSEVCKGIESDKISFLSQLAGLVALFAYPMAMFQLFPCD